MLVKKNILLVIGLTILHFAVYAQITLTHNVGNNPVKTDITTCEYEEYWARTFTLSDFGISTTDQFVIKSGQVAVSNSYDGARLVFNFYSIDSNFPNSEPERISYGNLVLAPSIGDTPEIVQIDFSTPIVIPAGVESILVEVTQMEDIYNSDYKKVLIAGTTQDNDTSWFKGCRELYTYTPTENLSVPVPNANFFINVTGELLNTQSSGSTTRLTHSICDDLIKPGIYGCTDGGMSWSRDFLLNDFGISSDEEFVINSGQVGIYYVGWGVTIQFRIYKIDNNFPTSFSDTDLIGSSQVVPVPYFGSNTSSTPKIVNVDFDTPVVVPNGVERILVEVYQIGAVSFPAGTEQDDNSVSWFRSYNGGCGPFGMFVDVKDLGYPDTKLYINVTGNVNHVTNNFEMNISNICSEFLKEFSVETSANIASVLWDFGDPASGADNTSTDLSPFHDFSADGVYTVTATVTANNGNTEVISETIDVKEPPNAYGINNVYACEDNFNTGISSSFDISQVESQVLGGQLDKVVTFIDGSGNEYNNLPNLFTNTIQDRETIRVRVAHKDVLCCYSETTFDLIVQPLPQANSAEDIYECQSSNNGFASFDLTTQNDIILVNQSNVAISYFNQNGDQIPNSELTNYTNTVIRRETITARVTNTSTSCYNETKFTINVNSPPIANLLGDLIGCDDNNDGISEFFDTSNIESQVLNGQTGLEVTYYNSNGNQISLPNPYTNITPNIEIISVRVTNPSTKCYSETDLVLQTSSKPQVNQPQNQYACDQGNGYALFDLSQIKNLIIGNQTGLELSYFNNFSEIPENQLSNYQNSEAFKETITVKVENSLNKICYSEISFDLVVNELPLIDLEESYFLCGLEPYLEIHLPQNFDNYYWKYQDGTIISNNSNVQLIKEGTYSVLVDKLENGIVCANSFSFELVRSVLPKIEEVKSGNFGNNYLEIIASGDGDFEYSIDGVNYQDSNIFNNVLGGNYLVFVRDKQGCGSDSRQISILDYPRFFSPNNDGVNDRWSLLGDINQNYKLYIFNRFGKLLKELNAKNNGWDGIYNGNDLPQDDYWFKVIFEDGTIKTGHFALRIE